MTASPHVLPLVLRRLAALLCALFLAGCQTAMSTSPLAGHDGSKSIDETYTNRASDWPLTFSAHQFDAYSFSTYGCEVYYRNMIRVDDPDDVLQPASEALGDKYPRILSAGMGPISNFPPPAQVTWRSKDGQRHQAEVDIGDIFKDQLIRHRVPREDISTVGSLPLPEIILEVNDRTINVYMKAIIWTKTLQIPGNRLSNQRSDMIKVYSRTY